LIGRRFADFLHPDDQKEIGKLFKGNHLKHNLARQAVQFRVLGKDGDCHWLEGNLRSKFDAKGGFIRGDGILREITPTKLLLDKLIRSERMAAMGQLAATVANQISSPMQCAAAMVNVIRKGRDKDEKLKDQLDLLIDAFDGIKDTIGQLTDLNSASQDKRQPADINQIVEETVALMKSLLQKKRVQVQFLLSPQLPKITVSAQQLGQVFMNLVQNSAEAFERMADEHRPSAEAQDRPTIWIESRWENRAAIIQFSDNGPGIAESDLSQIFDPFYSRKGTSALGIGLSICSSIVEAHGGTITASNLTKRGALFKIALPSGPKSEEAFK
jgi:signal transduction histidine kinase